MSIGHFKKLNANIGLFEKLAVAQSQVASGAKSITHSQMMMKKLSQRTYAK